MELSLGIRAKVKELNDRVADLETSLMKATEDKNNAIAQAEKTARKAGLADRLINGLSGENKRWTEEIKKFEVDLELFEPINSFADRRRKARWKRIARCCFCVLCRSFQYAFQARSRSRLIDLEHVFAECDWFKRNGSPI